MLVVLSWASVSRTQSANPHPGPHQKDFTSDAARGKEAFAATCAVCHGLDGNGGERAPSILDRPSGQRLPDSQVFRIIQNGIPGTGMPAFHSLESSQIKSLIAYLHALQGTNKALALPGDPGRGKTIFTGKAGCSRCHMIAGQGGFAASDLSAYGATHALEQIRTAIITPTPNSKLVTVSLHGGQKHVGRISNEDNFSLQLQTLDGGFQFISRSDIESIESNSQGLMPSDYASTLSTAELNDVISYLMSVAASGTPENPKKSDDWRD